MKVSFLLVLIFILSVPVIADVVPPDVAAVEVRMAESPNLYDQSDQYCLGKKPDEACRIEATTFAGGGNGTCQREVFRRFINLVCVRGEEIIIDRKLPDGGFVIDSRYCNENGEHSGERKFQCQPSAEMKKDRFCKKLSLDDACTVEFTYKRKAETGEGTCQVVKEYAEYVSASRPYSDGVREVLQCEPPELHIMYTPVSPIHKLFQ